MAIKNELKKLMEYSDKTILIQIGFSYLYEDNTRVFLQPDEKSFEVNFGAFGPNEFQKMISMSLSLTNTKSKYTITGLVDRAKCFGLLAYQSNHYVFKMNNQEVDSLPEDRANKPDYFVNSYFNLHLRRR